MGSPLGVFDDYEIGNLTPDECKELRKQIIEKFAASPEIREILNKKPTVLKPFLEANQAIRSELRKVVVKAFASGHKLRLQEREKD